LADEMSVAFADSSTAKPLASPSALSAAVAGAVVASGGPW
jgi:hypothetical protein